MKTISLDLAFLDKAPTLKLKIIKKNSIIQDHQVCAQMNENSFVSFWHSCRQIESQDKKTDPLLLTLKHKLCY
jgi:hypothetical protein